MELNYPGFPDDPPSYPLYHGRIPGPGPDPAMQLRLLCDLALGNFGFGGDGFQAEGL